MHSVGTELQPLPLPGACDPVSITLFPPSPPTDAPSASSDPFANQAQPLSSNSTGPHAPSPPYTLTTQGQHHTLLLALLSFTFALLSPPSARSKSDSTPDHLATFPVLAHFAWVDQRRSKATQLLLEAWHETGAMLANANARSDLTVLYIRLGRQVGITHGGVWTRVLELVKGRVRDELDEGRTRGGLMDADDDLHDDGEDGRARRIRAGVDRELNDALRGVGLTDEQKSDCVNGTTDLGLMVKFLEVGERESDLAVRISLLFALRASRLPPSSDRGPLTFFIFLSLSFRPLASRSSRSCLPPSPRSGRSPRCLPTRPPSSSSTRARPPKSRPSGRGRGRVMVGSGAG